MQLIIMGQSPTVEFGSAPHAETKPTFRFCREVLGRADERQWLIDFGGSEHLAVKVYKYGHDKACCCTTWDNVID